MFIADGELELKVTESSPKKSGMVVVSKIYSDSESEIISGEVIDVKS